MTSSTLNKAAAGFWVVMLLPGMTIWSHSVPFLIFISIYAIIAAHLSGITDKRAHCKYRCESLEDIK